MFKIGSNVKFIFSSHEFIGQIINMNYDNQRCTIYSNEDIFTIPFNKVDCVIDILEEIQNV